MANHTLFGDIVYDIIMGKFKDKDKKDIDDSVDKTLEYLGGISKRDTIRKKASGTICEYPMLVSSSISTETGSILTKGFEHEYLNLLILALSNNVEEEIGLGGSVSQILSKYHTNLGKAIYESCEDLINEGKDCFVEDYKIEVTEDNDINKIWNENLLVAELRPSTPRTLNEMSAPYDIFTEAKNNKNNKNDKYEKTSKNTNKQFKIEIDKLDFKKINKLAPTIISIKMKIAVKGTLDKSNGKTRKIGQVVDTVDKEVRIGVKGFIHELKSTDIILNIAKNLDDCNWILKFVKWRMGEIKFFRDIIFETENNKQSAKDKVLRGKSPLWNILRNMSKRNKTTSVLNFRKKYPMVATTTMIITMNEVEQIKKLSESQVDLYQNSNDVLKLLDTFFLLTFVIVDESAEMVYIFNEEILSFEVHTLNSVRAFGKEEIDMNNPTSMLKR